MLNAFGIASAIVMVTAYAFEARHSTWIAVFAVGCASTALYAVLTQAWIFAGLELLWSGLAIHRYIHLKETHEK